MTDFRLLSLLTRLLYVVGLCHRVPRPSSITRTAGFRYAEGTPKSVALSPKALLLQAAILPPNALPMHEAVARFEVAPAELSDLIDAVMTNERTLATRLLHAYAEAGTIARSGTFSATLRRCRQAHAHAECVALVKRLHSVGLRANPNQYISLLAGLGEDGQHEAALQVWPGLYRCMPPKLSGQAEAMLPVPPELLPVLLEQDCDKTGCSIRLSRLLHVPGV